MKIFLITAVILCSLPFLIPFSLRMAEISADVIESKLFRNDGTDSCDISPAQVKERVKYIFPSFWDVDSALVDFLVGKGFLKPDLILFLECNKLPKDFVASIKSGSDDEISELREMVSEYISKRIKVHTRHVVYGF